MMLALLLARQGIQVTLIEAHDDFDREFRGDTLHSSAMENLEQVGMAQKVLALCHARLEDVRLLTPESEQTVASFRRMRSSFPFVAIIPQAEFLDSLAQEARRYPGFRLLMGANAQRLIDEDGEIRGVIYRQNKELHEVRATLTIGADGRGSRLRRKAGFELRATAPPMDVVWFRLPRHADDADVSSAALRVGRGALLALLDRGEYWQAGYVIVKGSFRELRQAGIEELRQRIVEVVPSFQERVQTLEDFSQVSVLSVETGRVDRWYRPGLLLIGDAAHVMSPVGGVGINYAIQDAVATANLLTGPLKAGNLETSDLAAVQRRREWPTRVIQRAQAVIQKRVVAAALRSDRPFRLPWLARVLLRIRALRTIPARLIAYGARPEAVRYRAVVE